MNAQKQKDPAAVSKFHSGFLLDMRQFSAVLGQLGVGLVFGSNRGESHKSSTLGVKLAESKRSSSAAG